MKQKSISIILDFKKKPVSFFSGSKKSQMIPNPIHRCVYCRTFVDKEWVKIIEKLKNSGYLDEDYPIMCCWCFNYKFKKYAHKKKRWFI